MYPSYAATDADIIIVGAGISGMSAAFYLLDHEPTLKILILEATNRIGGRTMSLPLKIGKNNMRSFDVGGQFVSTTQIHLMDLLDKLNLHLVLPSSKQGKIILNLEPHETTTVLSSYNIKMFKEKIEVIQFLNKINTMSKKVSFSNPYLIDNYNTLDLKTMESFIVENLKFLASRNSIRHIIRTSCGVEPSQISVLFYLAHCNATDGMENQFLNKRGGAREMWIKGGADQICYSIATILGPQNIKKNDPVIKITRDSYLVTIETVNEIYICNYAIIAISPNEIIDINFKPPLEINRRQMLNNFQNGHLIKFVVTYETTFWRDQGYSGKIIGCGKENGHGPIHWCYDITYKNWPALTGCIASMDCLEQPDNSYKIQVLQQLALYFGEKALNPVDYYEKCWLDEPYIYSCVNCPDFGCMDKHLQIRRPIGRLFWAGTETAISWNGFIGGAVQAGYRAAIEVLYEYRPQILSCRDIEFIYSRRRRPSLLTNKLVSYGTNWKLLFPATIGLIFLFLYFRKKKTLI